MVHAKNYETLSTFVEVLQRKLWPLFSGHAVDIIVQLCRQFHSADIYNTLFLFTETSRRMLDRILRA